MSSSIDYVLQLYNLKTILFWSLAVDPNLTAIVSNVNFSSAFYQFEKEKEKHSLTIKKQQRM
jgi:hypothetical protein